MYDDYTTLEYARAVGRRLERLSQRTMRMDRRMLDDLTAALDAVRDNARARREERDAR
ncbi:hypothetical protein [Cellulosimicrobium sp. I38E]|uniref:hypothetical protein n=1 Tax=Cellulosimicrobium sp. I38E TaxID=1393139 RepID=UPI000B1064E7|nr:hypothetical protein [Cellulosimicrobium sp. I38E]